MRNDVERRLLDRMEGALDANAEAPPSARVRTALLIGFDFAVRESFVHLLGTPPPGTDDRLAALLNGALAPATPVLGHVLAAAWRAALVTAADGIEISEARSALSALELTLTAGS